MKRVSCWELCFPKLTSSRKGGGAFFALTGAVLLLSACDKPKPLPEVKPPAAPTKPASPTTSQAAPVVTPAVVENDLSEEVAAIRGKYPFKNAEELLQVPEVKEKVEAMGREMAADAQYQKRVDSTVDVAASLIGLDGAPESLKLNMDFKVYSDARTNRMLTAILTGTPQPWVDFVIGEVGEAVPDLSYGGLQKSNNGVSIEPLAPGGNP